MQEFIVQPAERGQRFDKYLRRHLPLAPSSFLYKMLRRKNITLRGKKADGSEKVAEGDVVTLFLSDETIRKFSAGADEAQDRNRSEEARRAYHTLTPLLGDSPVLYEDEDILLLAKPPGILSQKARPSDLSANEWLRGYLQENREKSPAEPGTKQLYTPSVCNRLDRNTGGILLCAKTLPGSRMLSEMIRERKLRKTYRMLVHGRITTPGVIEGDLVKDRERNHVCIAAAKDQHGVPASEPEGSGNDTGTGCGTEPGNGNDTGTGCGTKPGNGNDTGTGCGTEPGSRTGSESAARTCLQEPTFRQEQKLRHAVTRYRPVRVGKEVTLVEADLITGRSHQLRVHMASIGHPIVGDPRYGSRSLDRALLRKAETKPGMDPGIKRIRFQLLWCTAVTLPETGRDADAAVKTIRSPEPAWWKAFF